MGEFDGAHRPLQIQAGDLFPKEVEFLVSLVNGGGNGLDGSWDERGVGGISFAQLQHLHQGHHARPLYSHLTRNYSLKPKVCHFYYPAK